MPLNFAVDANTYLSSPNPPVTAQPVTLSCWFRYTGSPAAASLMCLYDTVNGDQVRIRYNGSNGIIGEVIDFGVSTATTGIVATSASAWHHAALTFASGSSNLKVYEDGTVGTSATPPTVTAADAIFIGANDTVDNPFDGLLSHVAAWNVVLTAAEVFALWRGVHPIRIRPQNLQAFWPFRSSAGAAGTYGVPNIFRNNAGHVDHRRNLNAIETPPSLDNSTFPPVAEYGWPQDIVSLAYERMRPDADVSDGEWRQESGGTNLSESIDEQAPADDADYIKSSTADGPTICKISISDLEGGIEEPLYVSYRLGKTGSGPASLIVRLLQGTTTIAEWTHDHVPALSTTVTQELSGAEFASITDFSDLYLEFESNVGTGNYSELTFRGSSESTAGQSTYTFSSLDFGTPSDDRYVIVATMGDSGEWPATVTVGGVAATQPTGNAGDLHLGMHIAHVPEGATGDIIVELATAATAYAICWWTVRMGNIGFSSVNADSTAGINPVLTAPTTFIPEGGFAVGITTVSVDITSATVSIDNSYVEAAAENAAESWTYCPIQKEVVAETTHTVTATWTANTAGMGQIVLMSFRGDGG